MRKSERRGLAVTARTRTDYLLIVGFCAFLFFYGLSQFGLIGADEPRYAQVAREMSDRHDWITPTLAGKPWLEKPPLYYWQTVIAYRLFGVSDTSARLCSALDATLMVIAAYLFLRRFRRGFELDGALMTASCAGVIGYARAASMDMPLAATFTIAMLGWWAWRENGKRIYLAVFWTFMALGMLAKGPIAPVLAVGVIVLYAIAARDGRLIPRTLWIPGILLFCLVVLPWYVAVQLRNPEFFRVFVLEHNLARFSTDLYHHKQPFWYYIPVTLLGLVPWVVFVLAALVETARAWGTERKGFPRAALAQHTLDIFLSIWLLVPVVFFSVSQSKLPGYILPGLPAGTLLLSDYVRRRLTDDKRAPLWLIVAHALVAASPIVPALMLPHLFLRHRIAGGQAAVVTFCVALALAAGIAATLASRFGLRMLRFVTLVPVVLVVAAVLKVGAATHALDTTLSARPLAQELSHMETKPLPLVVLGVPRETEYGLTFYRNQPIGRYEWGQVPSGEHLLVAMENSTSEIAKYAPGRRISYLGNFPPQHLDYYWISAPGMGHQR